MTVGEKLQQRLDNLGWTQDDAATKLRVSRFTVNQLITGKRNLTADMAVRLEHVFPAVRAEAWLALQWRRDLAEARARHRRGITGATARKVR